MDDFRWKLDLQTLLNEVCQHVLTFEAQVLATAMAYDIWAWDSFARCDNNIWATKSATRKPKANFILYIYIYIYICESTEICGMKDVQTDKNVITEIEKIRCPETITNGILLDI